MDNPNARKYERAYSRELAKFYLLFSPFIPMVDTLDKEEQAALFYEQQKTEDLEGGYKLTRVVEQLRVSKTLGGLLRLAGQTDVHMTTISPPTPGSRSYEFTRAADVIVIDSAKRIRGHYMGRGEIKKVNDLPTVEEIFQVGLPQPVTTFKDKAESIHNLNGLLNKSQLSQPQL